MLWEGLAAVNRQLAAHWACRTAVINQTSCGWDKQNPAGGVRLSTPAFMAGSQAVSLRETPGYAAAPYAPVLALRQVLLQAQGHQAAGRVRGAADISAATPGEGAWGTPGAAEAAARELLARNHHVSCKVLADLLACAALWLCVCMPVLPHCRSRA